MPRTDNSFSAPLGTMERFLRALQKEGLNPQAFCQRTIDDPTFRKELAYLMDPSLRPVPQPEYPAFQGEINLEHLRRLFTALIGRQSDDDSRVIRFCSAEGLREISHGIAQRDFDIIADRFGLGGASFQSRASVGEHYGLTESSIKRAEDKTLSRMRVNMKQIMEYGDFLRLPILEQPIEVLELSERSRFCLRRAGIRTVGDLVNKAEAYLMRITNFGPKNLDEVKQKLAERGLTLE